MPARSSSSRWETLRALEDRIDTDRFEELNELEVLSHVVRGRLNKQIAADLGVHERTVKRHRTAVTTKLGVQSVAELTQLSLEGGVFAAAPSTFPKGL